MDQKIVYIIYICLSMVVEKERKHKLQSSKKSYLYPFSHIMMWTKYSCKTTANHSYRNSVERCHCIANLGQQSSEMRRAKQCVGFVGKMKKYDFRKECHRAVNFLKRNSLSLSTNQKICSKMGQGINSEYILSARLLFSILQLAAEVDVDFSEQVIGELDRIFPNIDIMNDAKDLHRSTYFLQKHGAAARTYVFQLKKCNQLDCLQHK